MKLFWFPTPLDAIVKGKHDADGVLRVALPDTHPSGRKGQSIEIPDNLPDKNGFQLITSANGKNDVILRGILDKHYNGQISGLLVDDIILTDSSSSIPFGQVVIVNDHFECGNKRWPWRMMTGFVDYKVFLDGGDLRSLLKQSQDLNCHGRRVLPHIVNIVDFNPDNYGNSFYDRLPEYLALNAEFEQYVDFPVLSDTGYRGWSLGKCQEFWARFCDSVKGSFNRFVNLTNEFNHGGNLVGNVSDYPKPNMTVSQGSAVQDDTPPSPGWDYREWHAADSPTKFDHEYYIWQGLSTGGTPKPCVISEHGRRITESNLDLNYIRTLAYGSLANGCGLTVHTEDGKYSRLLGPNQSLAVKTAMGILNTVN